MREAARRYVLTQYLAHDHAERNHQGLGNHWIAPKPEEGYQMGPVMRRERLGGLLSYYYRDAAGRDTLFQHYEVTRGMIPGSDASEAWLRLRICP